MQTIFSGSGTGGSSSTPASEAVASAPSTAAAQVVQRVRLEQSAHRRGAVAERVGGVDDLVAAQRRGALAALGSVGDQPHGAQTRDHLRPMP